VAAALGWLVVELATGENLSVEEARERAERAAELARQRVGAAAENSGAAARELGRELGESARSGWRAVTRAARTRPFALGTVVLGAGLLTGIALPARRPQPPL